MRGAPTATGPDAADRARGTLARLSAACALILLAGTGPAAAAELALSGDLVGVPGQTVTSRLTITDVGGVAVESLDIRFTYDPAVLTFLTGRNGTGLDGGPFSPTDPIANDLGGTVIIAGTTLLVGVTPPEAGVLFELDFEIRGDAVPGAVTMQQLDEVRINESDLYTSLPPTPNATPGRVVVAASAPPPVFDVSVAKLDPTGIDLEIAWGDAGCVGDLDHQIVFGFGSQFPGALGDPYPLSGSQCSIGVAPPYAWLASPDPAVDSSRLLWWLVLATDGVIAEGAWGSDGAGGERTGPGPGTSSGECGIAAKDLSNGCMP